MDGQGKEKILIIEDNPVNLHALSFVLRDAGYTVLEALTGRMGLKMAEEELPDLVLLDIMMPEMDGFAVCRQLKANPRTNTIPILMVTGDAETASKVRCFDLGAADYITKPFQREEVLARIRSQLKLHHLTVSLEVVNRHLREKQRQLENDLQAAAEIQRSLLPKSFPENDCICFSFQLRPCQRIGGDLFNVQDLDEEHLAIYVMDVSGHGVPAAMITALVYQALLPQAGKVKQSLEAEPFYSISSPAAVCRLLEKEFPMDRFGRYFTMAYMILNVRSGEFRYSCAGHPPILQQDMNGAVIRHHKGGVMIGAGELSPRREEGKGILRPGDRLFFYTDGIIEHENEEGACFSLDGLEELLRRNRQQELGQLPARLTEELHRFAERQPFLDDITFLALECRGAGR